MLQPVVPVTMGSPSFRNVDATSCRVTEAAFAAGDALPVHTHDRPILAVMLSGSFETVIRHRRLDCRPHTVWTEPVGEPHANYVGTGGARVLVTQLDPAALDVYCAVAPLLECVSQLYDPLLSLDAHRVLREMDRVDRLSPLAIDSLVLGMHIRALRLNAGTHTRQAPPWLRRLREMLCDEFRSPPSLATLAREAGCTPTHVCHAFKAHVGMTVGQFARTVRAAWAAERIRCSNDSLAAIAAAAGYYDQSHLSRDCRQLLGWRPSEYRRAGGHQAAGKPGR